MTSSFPPSPVTLAAAPVADEVDDDPEVGIPAVAGAPALQGSGGFNALAVEAASSDVLLAAAAIPLTEASSSAILEKSVCDTRR